MITIKDKELIKQYVKANLGKAISVRKLSEYLIENGANGDRFNSGKPIIFGYISIYLNSYNYIKKNISHDYKEVDFVFDEELSGTVIELPVPEKVQKVQRTNEVQEESQMSLF